MSKSSDRILFSEGKDMEKGTRRVCFSRRNLSCLLSSWLLSAIRHLFLYLYSVLRAFSLTINTYISKPRIYQISICYYIFLRVSHGIHCIIYMQAYEFFTPEYRLHYFSIDELPEKNNRLQDCIIAMSTYGLQLCTFAVDMTLYVILSCII